MMCVIYILLLKALWDDSLSRALPDKSQNWMEGVSNRASKVFEEDNFFRFDQCWS